MGFHVSWITTRGKPENAVRVELQLVETQKREYVPESDVTGVLLPSGWYTVFFNDALPPELSQEVLARLSDNAEVMAFVVEEASMVSLGWGFANGRKTWEIVHDSNQGLDHLEVNGTPPSHLAVIRNRLLQKLESSEQGPDYLFDVPAELCKATTGFRHDEEIDGIDGDAFVVLDRA
jgi:hypothetical protein